MSRLYVLMEVCKTDNCDVDGNAVYHPVDGGRGELMWLRKDRVIECADSGPCYKKVPKKGDRVLNTDVIALEVAEYDWSGYEEEYFCFPAPARGEKQCSTCKHYESDEEEYPCDPCIRSGEGGNKRNAYWKPKDEPDPAEWCGGALGGVL